MANYKKPTRLKDKNIFLLLPENGLLPTKADMDLAISIEFKLEILAVRSLRTSRLSWRRWKIRRRKTRRMTTKASTVRGQAGIILGHGLHGFGRGRPVVIGNGELVNKIYSQDSHEQFTPYQAFIEELRNHSVISNSKIVQSQHIFSGCFVSFLAVKIKQIFQIINSIIF